MRHAVSLFTSENPTHLGIYNTISSGFSSWSSYRWIIWLLFHAVTHISEHEKSASHCRGQTNFAPVSYSHELRDTVRRAPNDDPRSRSLPREVPLTEYDAAGIGSAAAAEWRQFFIRLFSSVLAA